MIDLRIHEGLDDQIYDRLKAKLKVERTWCEEEIQRLNEQLTTIRNRFLNLEQVKVLRIIVGDKLDRANFDDKRFILEALEARVYVSNDGGKRIAFSIPDDAQTVLTNPGRCPPRPVL